MNISSESKTFDRELQRVDFDLEWKQERTFAARQKLLTDIKKHRIRTQVQKTLGYIATAGFSLAVVFIASGLYNGQFSLSHIGISADNPEAQEELYKTEVINGRETLVFTEEGMKHVIYPLDAHKKIPTIAGEPIISLSKQSDWSKEVILTYAWYPTDSPGRFISVHNTLNEKKSVDEMISVFIPQTTMPLYGRNITEMNINGAKAVLYEPTTDKGQAELFIVTEKYVYYLSNAGKDFPQGDSKELVELAQLFNFNREK